MLRQARRTPEGRPITKAWLVKQLSTYLGRKVASSTIYRIESGEDMPGGDLLTALLDVLGGRFGDVQWLIKNREATVDDGRRLAIEALDDMRGAESRLAAEAWLALSADERKRVDSVFAALILNRGMRDRAYEASRLLAVQLSDAELEEALAVFKRLRRHPEALQRWLGYADRLLDESDDDVPPPKDR
jgi:hypothetical protein